MKVCSPTLLMPGIQALRVPSMREPDLVRLSTRVLYSSTPPFVGVQCSSSSPMQKVISEPSADVAEDVMTSSFPSGTRLICVLPVSRS